MAGTRCSKGPFKRQKQRVFRPVLEVLKRKENLAVSEPKLPRKRKMPDYFG